MRSRDLAVVVALMAAATLPPRSVVAQAAPPSTTSATPAQADSIAPVFRRAQRLVNDGAGAEGRALVDSVLEATEPRSAEEAEALYWRATLAESWEKAQRDYLRLMLEHERSPRAGDAMLRLAQGEVARGDREAAERYLERLAREAPASPARAEGGLWHGRLLIERGQRNEGCALLRSTRALVRTGAVELENQFEYLLRDCPAAATATAAAPATAPATPREPRPTTTPPPATATPPATAPRKTSPEPPASSGASATVWSVQVAALGTATEARRLAERLKSRGYDARVDGTAAPFRVRFGRFPTRAAATSASEAYREKERGGSFVVEVPRA
ncbi:MAG TPA: SPOR domain-containing protein [Gemmatimonadaceae bacterium]|nr:SPOR domain-containing protein [Gemmatimonadaceae bacterium]